MFDSLSDRLEGVLKTLRGLGKISESNVNEAVREVRMALLEADVDLNVTKAFIDTVKIRTMGDEVLKSITPGQQIVKIFHDELTNLLGGDAAPLNLEAPAHILVCGLNGAGKTTTCAKLARRLKKEGRRPVLIALDLYRPAAIEQLATLAREIGVPMFTPEAGEADVLRTTKRALEWLKTQNANVVIFDTAGRQEIDDSLVQELRQVGSLIQPGETLLVADAATGQQAVSVATHFHEAVGITGLILTKLDGDARGGAALSMRAVTQQPIKFIGVGEKLDQLDVFVPARLADRILGMGDVVGLVEKAADAIDEKDAMKMMERMGSGDFDFNDFLAQMKFMKKLGPLEGLLGLLPGMKGLKGLKDMKMEDGKMERTEAIVLSMTPQERRKPDLINSRRRQRIARGSGTQVSDVNQLLDGVQNMRRMFKDKGKMGGLMKMMGGGGGGMPGMGDLLGGSGGGLPRMPGKKPKKYPEVLTTTPFFELLATDPGTAARRGRLTLAHGVVETPVFMPVGTQATVKSAHPAELREIGTSVILNNTYHLLLRPGLEVIRRFGSVHGFMQWDRPVLTDSGGFQIFSLSELRKITEEGVHFQSHLDGSRLFLGPETAMESQAVLGSDIAMVLDECPPHGCGREHAESNLALTQRWAVRCKAWIDAHRPLCDNGLPQAHFGIVQGSVYRDLRERAARELAELDFPGYAIGGISVGETEREMLEAVTWAAPLLPSTKPRYAMGLGTPPQILEMVARGVDMFDCVLPSRVARNGAAFTVHGLINLRNKQFELDQAGIDPAGGTCSACAGFSRGYIRHLIKAGEILGLRLLTLHNLHFYLSLMRQTREHVQAGTFGEFKTDFIARYQSSKTKHAIP